MKQCTICGTTYTDDTLNYCLADGGPLNTLTSEADTVVRHGVRVDITRPQAGLTQPVADPSSRPSNVWKILIAVFALGFLGILILGAAGAFYYFSSGSSSVITSPTTPDPTAPPVNTSDPEKEKLQQELANLKKKIDEVNNSDTNSSDLDFGSDFLPTARVDSPNDGFLALRSEPDAEKGERLAKIPNGTLVTVVSCDDTRITIGSRTGRWCLITYDSHAGWVFDAWLAYSSKNKN